MGSLKSPTVISSIIVFFFFILLYFYSAARTITGYGDSDEIITISYLLGSAHPSGYSLTIVLTHLFMMLPVSLSIAFKAQIFAAICHSFAISLLNLAVYKIISLINPSMSTRKKILSSILTALVVGTSALYWLYAGVLEVNALNMIFFGLLAVSYLYWLSETEKTEVNSRELVFFGLMAISFGLGVSNVHTFILLLPGTAVAIIYSLTSKKRWSLYLRVAPVLVGSCSLVISWLIPSLVLFYLNSRETDFSWFFPQTVTGWWQMIFRRDYAGTIIDQGGRKITAYISIKSAMDYFQGFQEYFVYLNQHYSWISLAFGLVGILFAWRLNWPIYLVSLLWWIVSGPLFGSYMGFPDNPGDLDYRTVIGIAHRQLILGEFALGLLIGLGAVYLYKRFHRGIFIYLISVTFCMAFIHQVSANSNMAIQRDYSIAYNYAKELLDTPEDNSVIICFSDISCFSLLYLQNVERYRPSVTVLTKNNLYQKYFLERNPQYQGFPYPYNPFFTADLISWNASTRPTYLSESDSYYINHVGLDGDPWYLIPKGQLFQVTSKIPTIVTPPDMELSNKLLSATVSPKNYISIGQRDYMTQKNNSAAAYYAKLRYPEYAKSLLNQSLILSPSYVKTKEIILLLPQLMLDPKYIPGNSSPEVNQIYSNFEQEYSEYLSDPTQEKLAKSYKTLMKATYRDPRNLKIREALARFYVNHSYSENAMYEIERIMRVDPHNQVSHELLNRLSTINY